ESSSKGQVPNPKEIPTLKTQRRFAGGISPPLLERGLELGSWKFLVLDAWSLELLLTFVRPEYSQTCQSLQIRENQLRQFPAVTALQNAECRNAQAAHGLSEPVEVLRLERLLRDRVACVSVKPG